MLFPFWRFFTFTSLTLSIPCSSTPQSNPNLPFKLDSMCVDSIKLSIPWSSLYSKSVKMEVKGVRFEVSVDDSLKDPSYACSARHIAHISLLSPLLSFTVPLSSALPPIVRRLLKLPSTSLTGTLGDWSATRSSAMAYGMLEVKACSRARRRSGKG